MTRILLTFVLATLPCAAQFRSMKIWFSGTGCATCTESLGERMKRVRGVESAQVNAEEGTLELQLTPQNRVRLEQIRDFIEQDGTKATRAVVHVNGEMEKLGDRWILRAPGVLTSYEITGPDLKPGPAIVAGEVSELRAASGTIRIRATRVKAAQAP